MREIRKLGDPVLRRVCKPVRRVTGPITELLDEMVEVMDAAPGLGLAAPQIGVCKRLVVARINDDLLRMINPEVVRSSGTSSGWEGCLSHPGWMGLVTRDERVTIRYTNVEGKTSWVEADSMAARIFQHEIDHLDGIMFVDRAKEMMTEKELDEQASSGRGLKVIAIGTPEFALPAFNIVADHCDLGFVITQPDRPAGRRRQPVPSPVKQWAIDRDITVLQPDSCKDPELLKRVQEFAPDVLVVAAYGQIIPGSLLEIAELGALNIHPSLLPRYRGAAPIQRAIMSGDDMTGVSIMWMDEGLDTGDVALQVQVPIRDDDTGGSLAGRLAGVGCELLVEALGQLIEGKLPRVPQDDSLATCAQILRREDEKIDWSMGAAVVDRKVRALQPTPAAYTDTEAGPVKIIRGRIVPGEREPRRVAVIDGSLVIGCGDSSYEVVTLKPAGAREMDSKQFILGRSGIDGATWGSEQ